MTINVGKNQPGPYLLDIPYQIQNFMHHATFNCDITADVEPGTDPDDVQLRTRDGLGRILSNAAASYWANIRGVLPIDAVGTSYTLWKLLPGDDKKYYVSSGTLTPTNGGSGSSVLARQMTLTFRTARSGIARCILLEGSWAQDTIAPAPAAGAEGAGIAGLVGFYTDGQSPVIARDKSWIVQALSVAYTQNERMYEARHRK
jgi:hypothetical protein